MMNITVQSIHFDADIKLIAFIRDKIQKLNQFHDHILGTEVFLRLDKDGSHRANKVVEIRLTIPGKELFAKRRNHSFEAAADEAVEALRRQVERNKERLRAAS
jgi:putative sigma-54 modulation protein